MFQTEEFKENMIAHSRGGLVRNISNFITDSTFTGMVTAVNVINQVLSSVKTNTMIENSYNGVIVSVRKVLIRILVPDTFKPGTAVLEFIKTLNVYVESQVDLWVESSPVTVGLTESFEEYTDVIIVDIFGNFNTEVYIDAEDDLECSYYIIQKYALGMSRLTNGLFLISETTNSDEGVNDTTLLMRHVLVQNSEYPFIELSEFYMLSNELSDSTDCIVSEYLLTDVSFKRKNIDMLDKLLEDTDNVLFVSDSQAIYDYIKSHDSSNSVVTTNAYMIMRGMVSPPDNDNWFADSVYHITDEEGVTKLPPLKHTRPTIVECHINVTSDVVE